MVADRTDSSDSRTVSFGALGAALGLGFVFGPALGGLIGALDPRAPFLVGAALTLVNLVLVLRFLPETRQGAAASGAAATPLRWWSREAAALRTLLAVYFLFYLGFSGFTGVFVVDARLRFGWGPQASGLLLCFVGVVAVLVQGGLLPRLLRLYPSRRLAELGLILVATALLGVAAIRQGEWLYLTQFFFAAGVGISTPGLRSLLSTAVDDSLQGLLGGLTQGCVSLTSLLGPLAAGRLYNDVGYRFTFHAAAGVIFLAAGLLLVSRKPSPRERLEPVSGDEHALAVADQLDLVPIGIRHEDRAAAGAVLEGAHGQAPFPQALLDLLHAGEGHAEGHMAHGQHVVARHGLGGAGIRGEEIEVRLPHHPQQERRALGQAFHAGLAEAEHVLIPLHRTGRVRDRERHMIDRLDRDHGLRHGLAAAHSRMRLASRLLRSSRRRARVSESLARSRSSRPSRSGSKGCIDSRIT